MFKYNIKPLIKCKTVNYSNIYDLLYGECYSSFLTESAIFELIRFKITVYVYSLHNCFNEPVLLTLVRKH